MRVIFGIDRQERETDNIMTAIGALIKEESRVMATKDPVEMEWGSKVRQLRMTIMETAGAHGRTR